MIDQLINGPLRPQFFATAYALLAIGFGWLGCSVLTHHFSRPRHERESIGVLGGIVVLVFAVVLAVQAFLSASGVVK